MRHFDSHRAIQLLVLGQVDEAESPFAEQPLNSVASDSFRQDGGRIGCVRGLQPLNGAGDRFAFGHSLTFSAF